VCPTTGKRFEELLHRKPEIEHRLLGTVLDGKYRILRVIGQGGLGVVFEAEHVISKRLVAVKIVLDLQRPEAIERFHREVEIVSALQHPNLCDVYDFGAVPREGPYFVSERLFGEPLSAYRRRHARAPTREVVDILVQMLAGLQLAHTRGIVHRDLKPENIFLVDRLGREPLVKLLDFGLAVRPHGPRITLPGRAMGTPRYMSPEQLCGKPLTHHSDLFSTALVAFELLAGVHPFDARTAVDLSVRVLRGAPTPLASLNPRVPPEVIAVIDRALAKDPRDRFGDAEAMQRALLRCATGRFTDDDDDQADTSPDSASGVC
jgi:serine/threonine-protein kinase